MKKFAKRFLRDNRAVTAIEYGLIAGLVVLVIATSVTNIGTSLKTVLNAVQALIVVPAAA
ncbi:Flp family type IVb pilin [Paraburkholderia fungorum]|jgi:pilus assembly protein Flp/PilA|uniref:Flp family type IVb pilin n=1 Tax=Paraburkholderia fungorum TaxID=134537 RepID=A0AAJ3SLW8_9BURK|nr:MULTISPECIES: Flp family type IVb pilin [Paraburkholderia]MBB5547217.1 pilus assembly protein Flp/PilA [Paraburkholderia fungorum]MDE1007970.1 Flp family type IVb pilin [Paraburkholderia fungorum]MDT8839300.1 Flp family type IVb pilin [Paraburkholderia fungorum]PNE55854.1 Flp family type IVb pilin [Paraburkholderia fungorum]PRZ52136.1 pilus assembly protein Flp/PilA [Paraburkholderia fungorum]